MPFALPAYRRTRNGSGLYDGEADRLRLRPVARGVDRRERGLVAPGAERPPADPAGEGDRIHALPGAPHELSPLRQQVALLRPLLPQLLGRLHAPLAALQPRL